MRSHPPGCRWFNGRPARQGARDLSLTVEKPGFLSLAALLQASALGISLSGPDQHLWWPQVSELRCNQGSGDGHPAIGAGRASQPAKCLADIGFGVSALATLNQIPRMLERGRTVGTAFSPGFPLLRPQFVCQPALRPMRRADNTRRAAKPSTGFPGDLWVSKRAMNSSS